jgi:hypothetical protein
LPLVRQCADPRCPVLTMGPFCIDHEREAVRRGEVALLEAMKDAAVLGDERGERRGLYGAHSSRV